MIRSLLASILLCAALAACGSDADDITPASASTPPADPLPAPQPARGSVTGMPDGPGPGDVPLGGRPAEALETAPHGDGLPPLAEEPEAGLTAGDRYLMVNPYFHMFGLKAGILASVTAGATMLPEPVFDAGRALASVADEKITVLPGAPTLYQSLLDHPDRDRHDLSSLRVAVTGAADIPVTLISRIVDELPFPTVVSGYGLTEAGTASATELDDDPETIATTVGRARPGFEIRIVDGDADVATGETGEVVLRGPSVMQGYLDDPPATAAAPPGARGAGPGATWSGRRSGHATTRMSSTSSPPANHHARCDGGASPPAGVARARKQPESKCSHRARRCATPQRQRQSPNEICPSGDGERR